MINKRTYLWHLKRRRTLNNPVHNLNRSVQTTDTSSTPNSGRASRAAYPGRTSTRKLNIKVEKLETNINEISNTLNQMLKNGKIKKSSISKLNDKLSTITTNIEDKQQRIQINGLHPSQIEGLENALTTLNQVKIALDTKQNVIGDNSLPQGSIQGLIEKLTQIENDIRTKQNTIGDNDLQTSHIQGLANSLQLFQNTLNNKQNTIKDNDLEIKKIKGLQDKLAGTAKRLNDINKGVEALKAITGDNSLPQANVRNLLVDLANINTAIQDLKVLTGNDGLPQASVNGLVVNLQQIRDSIQTLQQRVSVAVQPGQPGFIPQTNVTDLRDNLDAINGRLDGNSQKLKLYATAVLSYVLAESYVVALFASPQAQALKSSVCSLLSYVVAQPYAEIAVSQELKTYICVLALLVIAGPDIARYTIKLVKNLPELAFKPGEGLLYILNTTVSGLKALGKKLSYLLCCGCCISSTNKVVAIYLASLIVIMGAMFVYYTSMQPSDESFESDELIKLV